MAKGAGMSRVDRVIYESQKILVDRWLQGDHSLTEGLGRLVEMAHYPCDVSGWYLIFYNVKIGGSPRRVDLLEVGTGKKWMITFDSSGFDFSKCEGDVPGNVTSSARKILSRSNVLRCAMDYWTNILVLRSLYKALG